MATAGDERAPYGSGEAGGKFRKRPIRRSVPATPYDRPPTAPKNNNPSLLTKLVDPASRLIYAGAHRLFGAFRKRLPPQSLQGPPEINEEPQNVLQEAGQNNCTEVSARSGDQGGDSTSISAATGISELEQMLKHKTFTRSEIERLTAMLHSRTTESTSDYVVERDGTKPPSSLSPILRLEASTSGSLRKHGDERDNFHAAVLTPFVNSRIHEEEIASPAELAKAYMGSRPTKVASSPLRQDPKLLNNATGIQKTPFTLVTPKTANSLRGLENGFLTPRSRGRSAMYSMVRTPYSRNPSTFSQKGIRSIYGHDAALTSSQAAWGHDRKLALKRRSSVLDDDIGSGGPLRRIRQKANLLSQRSSMQQNTTSQKLLLRNEPEPNVIKGIEENGDVSMRGSSYASVPTKSTQMATKIFQQLERLSPKEKKPGSTPTKLALNMLHGQALRSLEKVDSPKVLPSPRDSQKSEVQHHTRLHDSTELTSKSKDKVEENGSRRFSVPRNMFTSVNGDTITDSPSKLPTVEPPQKKHAFQMSAPEDSLELDDDIYANGHVSFPSVENNKLETSGEEVQNLSPPPEVREPPALAEVTPVLPDVTKIPEQAELKEAENGTSLKTGVSKQGIGFTLPTSPPSTTTTQSGLLPQSTLEMDKVSPEKYSNSSSLFGTRAGKASPFQFSANEPSEFKLNANSDRKTLDSTSVFSSFTKINENGNDQKSANTFGKLEFLSSAVPAATSTSGIFSFGSSASASSTPNTTPASSPPIFPSLPSFPASGANMNSIFINGSSTTTTAASSSLLSTHVPSPVLSTSVPAPIFSFGSATTPTSASMAETGNNNATNEKEMKSNMTSSPFASTSFTTTTTGSSLFGFNSPAAVTSTTNNLSQGSQANTQAVSFQFGSSVPSLAAESTSGGSLFGSSAPAFGSSPSFGTSSVAPAWQPPKSSGFGSTFGSSPVFSFGASSTDASTGSSMFSSNSSFATPSQGQPGFGKSTPVFGAVISPPNNNDQRSLEDSMVEDSMQTPSPSVSPFGQAPAAAPGFMFGSATPTQTTTQAAAPFQFNQAPSQNPFQSSSVEFNGGGGSFSLGSGGDKSGRRMVRVKKTNRRKP